MTFVPNCCERMLDKTVGDGLGGGEGGSPLTAQFKGQAQHNLY